MLRVKEGYYIKNCTKNTMSRISDQELAFILLHVFNKFGNFKAIVSVDNAGSTSVNMENCNLNEISFSQLYFHHSIYYQKYSSCYFGTHLFHFNLSNTKLIFNL